MSSVTESCNWANDYDEGMMFQPRKCEADTSECGTEELSSECSALKGTDSSTESGSVCGAPPSVPWLAEAGIPELQNEIWAFGEFISLGQHEKAARNMARSTIQQVVQQFWPLATVKTYGSFACDLSLPQSELDLVVEDCAPTIAGRVGPLKDYLQAIGFETLGFLDGDTDAFIKVREGRTNLVCNISLTDANSPVRQTVLKMKRVLTRQPAAAPVLKVIRTVLDQCSLTDVPSGGVSSYALTLMVFHILKKYETVVGADVLLKDFLKTFGSFDYKNETICPMPNMQATIRMHPGDVMSISDVSDPSSNAAESITKIRQVKAMLKYLSLALEKWDSSDDCVDSRGKTPLSTIIAHKQLWQRRA